MSTMATRTPSNDRPPGKKVEPSFRRARLLYEEAVELGDPLAAEHLDHLQSAIEKVRAPDAPFRETRSRGANQQCQLAIPTIDGHTWPTWRRLPTACSRTRRTPAALVRMHAAWCQL